MNCPNKNTKEYKEMMSALGEELTHYLWNRNNGNPIHLTPNGKSSKLYNDLLKLYNGDVTKALQAKARVYSKEFINWFGNWIDNPKQASKVVDENGEPLMVYHGTSEEFTQFNKSLPYNNIFSKLLNNTIKKEKYFLEKEDKYYISPEEYFTRLQYYAEIEGEAKEKDKKYNKINTGIYFTDNIEYSTLYGKITMPLFINIRNSFYFNEVSKKNIDKLQQNNKLDITKYDGIIGKEVKADYGEIRNSGNENSFVVFEPNQIKSALPATEEQIDKFELDENKLNTFDENSDNIYYSKGYEEILQYKNAMLSNKNISDEQKEKAYKQLGIKKENGDYIMLKDIHSNSAYYQKIAQTGIVAIEKTIRDIAEDLSYRTGIPFEIINDTTKEWKGRILNNVAYINLAYATLDTPIHEIIGHPLIRAIKNENKELYNNLLKELEYGKGKEVFERIKNTYKYHDVKIPHNDVKREYLFDFELNGVSYTYDQTANGNLIFTKFYKDVNGEPKNELITRQEYDEALKQKYPNINVNKFNVQIKGSEYTLEEQQEEVLVELLGLYTANKLDKKKDKGLIGLLRKLLEKMSDFMKQLFKQREIKVTDLPDNMTLNDISNLLAYTNSKIILPGYKVVYHTPDGNTFETYKEASNHMSQLYKNIKEISINNIYKPKNFPKKFITNVNEIPDSFTNQYGEIFRKTKYGGYHKDVIIDFELNIGYTEIITEEEFIREYNNLISNNITEFKNSNRQFDENYILLEIWKKMNNVRYNPEEVYSRNQSFYSFFGAYATFDVKLLIQNLLNHIEDNVKSGGKFTISAITKPIDRTIAHIEEKTNIYYAIYPQPEDIEWAATADVGSGSVWDAPELVNRDIKSEKLGVSYTKVPRFGNLRFVKNNLASIIDNIEHHHNELGISLTPYNFRLKYKENTPVEIKKLIDNFNKILDDKYGKLKKPKIYNNPIQPEKTISITKKDENMLYEYVNMYYFKGRKETMDQIREKINYYRKQLTTTNKDNIEEIKAKVNFYAKLLYAVAEIKFTRKEVINTRIGELKLAGNKYPRSLIVSEVKPIQQEGINFGFKEDELPFQKLNKPLNKTKVVTSDFVRQIPIVNFHSPEEMLFKLQNTIQEEREKLKHTSYSYTVKEWQTSIKKLREEYEAQKAGVYIRNGFLIPEEGDKIFKVKMNVKKLGNYNVKVTVSCETNFDELEKIIKQKVEKQNKNKKASISYEDEKIQNGKGREKKLQQVDNYNADNLFTKKEVYKNSNENFKRIKVVQNEQYVDDIAMNLYKNYNYITSYNISNIDEQLLKYSYKRLGKERTLKMLTLTNGVVLENKDIDLIADKINRKDFNPSQTYDSWLKNKLKKEQNIMYSQDYEDEFPEDSDFNMFEDNFEYFDNIGDLPFDEADFYEFDDFYDWQYGETENVDKLLEQQFQPDMLKEMEKELNVLNKNIGEFADKEFEVDIDILLRGMKGVTNNLMKDAYGRLIQKIKITEKQMRGITDEFERKKYENYLSKLKTILSNGMLGNNIWNLMKIIESDLTYMLEGLKNNKINESNIDYYNNLLNLWKGTLNEYKIGSISKFGDYMRYNVKLQKSIMTMLGMIEQIEGMMLEIDKENFLKAMNKVLNKKVDESVYEKVQEVTLAKSLTLDLSRTNNEIATALFKLMNNADNARLRNFNKFSNEFESKVKDLLDKGIDVSDPEIASQFIDFDNGEFIDYYTLRHRAMVNNNSYLWGKLHKELQKLKHISEEGKRERILERISKTRYKLENNYKFTIDTLKINKLAINDKNEITRNYYEYDEEQMNKLHKKLRILYGYNNLIADMVFEDLKRKLNEFKEQALYMRDVFEEHVRTSDKYTEEREKRESETDEQVENRIQFRIRELWIRWLRANSPYMIKSTADITENNTRMLFVLPKVGDINRKFVELSKNKDLFDFYMYLRKVMKQYSSYLPLHIQERISPHMLPQVQKEFFEKLKQVNYNMSEAVNYLNKELTVSKNQITSKSIEEMSVPTRFVGTTPGQIQEMIYNLGKFLEELEKEKAHPNVIAGVKEKIIELQDKKDKLVKKQKEEFTTDIVKMVKSFVNMAETYKSFSEVEGLVLEGRRILQTIKTVKNQNEINRISNKAKSKLFGTSEEELNERYISEGAKELLKMVDYTIKAKMYQKKLDHTFVKRELPNMEKRDKEQYKTIKKKKRELKMQYFVKGEIDEKEYNEKMNKLDLEEDELFKKYEDDPQRYKSYEKIVDFLNRITSGLNIGLNVKSAVNNYAFGKLSMIIHAQGEEDYRPEDLKFAFKTLNRAMRQGANSLELQKIKNLMQLYNVVFEMEEAAYGVKDIKKVKSEKFDMFKFYGMMRKGEFYLQNATMIALMNRITLKVKNIKTGKEVEKTLWDLYDINGEFSNEYLYWNEEEGMWTKQPVNYNTDVKTTESNEFTRLVDWIQQSNKHIHGNYDPRSPIRIKSNVIGRMLMIYKSWIAEGWSSFFEREIYDDMLGRDRKGKFRTMYDIGLYNAFQMLLRNTFNKTELRNNKALSDIDKANMLKNVAFFRALLILGMGKMVLMLLVNILKGRGEDEWKLRVLRNMLSQLSRLDTDISYYMSPGAIINTYKQPMPVITLTGDFLAWLGRSRKLFMPGYYSDSYTIGKWTYSGMRYVPGLNEIRKWIEDSEKAEQRAREQ